MNMNFLNITSLLIATVILSCTQTAQKKQIAQNNNIQISADTSFNFENYTEGKIPKDWFVALTGKGEMCEWKIINDKANKVLAQISSERPDYRFNLAVNKEINYKDLEISLRFKAISGNKDQGGGPVWRYIDENNYYVARANPLENNFRVYKVVDGDRKELESARIKMTSGQWYNIKISMKGNEIKCYFNNTLQLETTDNTFANAGKIGLWTKSDAISYFDDLIISNL